MGISDRFEIGRKTKRFLGNIIILGLIFVILYWDSNRKNNNNKGYSNPQNRRNFDTGVDEPIEKRHDKSRSEDDEPAKYETTPTIQDHTPGETEGLGMFRFFGQLWGRGDEVARQRGRGFDKDNEQPAVGFSQRVTNEQINKFHLGLPPLLPNYRNPCWVEELPQQFDYEKSYYSECSISRKRQVSKHAHKFRAFEQYLQNRTTSSGKRWRIRCFPYFFLLGVGKSGTTDFFDTLKDYVSDFVPGFLKELHFWEWKRCHERELCRSIDPRHPNFADYLDTYDAASEVIRRTVIKRRDGSSYHPLVIGDFTPSTLTFQPCWERLPGNEHLQEPRYTTAHYIYSIQPQSKFIIMLRDPVERVYSNYRMQSRLSKQPEKNAEGFHKDVSKVIRDLEKCFKEKSHRACAYENMKFDIRTHVTNSLYEIFIHDWFQLFPKEQFLVIKMEEYNKSRVPFIKQTIDFLGLTPMTQDQEWQIDNKIITNVNTKKGDMNAETRTLLRNFFRPWNQRLVKILKDKGFHWDY